MEEGGYLFIYFGVCVCGGLFSKRLGRIKDRWNPGGLGERKQGQATCSGKCEQSVRAAG